MHLAGKIHDYLEFNLTADAALALEDTARFDLTARELDAVGLLCCGRTNLDRGLPAHQRGHGKDASRPQLREAGRRDSVLLVSMKVQMSFLTPPFGYALFKANTSLVGVGQQSRGR
jgi:hypothetical protein